MTVKELITALEKLPPDKDVWAIYDGMVGLSIAHVWIAHSGDVMLADSESEVYKTEARPETAPTYKECFVWYTPRKTTKEPDPPSCGSCFMPLECECRCKVCSVARNTGLEAKEPL